jgi:hypothetical protein
MTVAASLASYFLYMNERFAVKNKGAARYELRCGNLINHLCGYLFLMIKRSRSMSLGLAACIGALASLLLGTVTVNYAMLFLMRHGAYDV